MGEYAGNRTSAPGREAPKHAHAPATVPGRTPLEELGSFDEIVAQGAATAVPDDARRRFEAVHGVELADVRVHVVPMLAEHGVRGLSRGRQIALAELGDREALEHELGHVVDCAGAGGAAPNAAIDGLELADDPAREARADQLAAQAKQPPPAARQAQPRPLRAPAAAGAAQPKLTNRAAIARNGGQFVWTTHKTAAQPRIGGGFEVDGLGAVLSTVVQLSFTGTTQHGQLDTLVAITPPQFVDDTRPPLPAPPRHFAGHHGCYVLPAAILGAPTPSNLLYLPASALGELAAIQTQMIDLAKKGPGKLSVKTLFGVDGLANSVSLVYEALDRTTGAPVYQLAWHPVPDPDRTKWSTEPSAKPATGGVAPTTAEWRTHVEWKPTTGDGDGVEVVADKLGPDHPLGSAPSDATAKSRVTTLENAAKKPKGVSESYIAGHLLNDHLGGPGNLSANLAPIPMKANGQMSKSIEKPAKDVVNDQRGWIRYEVAVKHLQDPKNPLLSYPAKISAKMAIYDASGALQNPTSSTIDIDPPSSFADGTANPPTAVGKLSGAALESSPKMLDEVVLSHENDLRPFLRDGAELFDLIIGSELNPNADNSKLAAAWTMILEGLRQYEITALPNLNMLATVTSALERWQIDPVAMSYLATVRVGELRRGLFQCFLDANTFATAANHYLQQASAAVKKTVAPSDLFRNAQILNFANQLVTGLPEDVTMLQVMMSQQQSAIPFRDHRRHDAKERGDVTMEAEENQVRDQFRAQDKPDLPTFPSSPTRVFQEYGSSVHDLSVTSMFGAEFESVRMKKVLDMFVEWTHTDGVLMCNLLREDPELKTSERLQALLWQVAQLITDWKASRNSMVYNMSVVKVTWKDSLETIAMKEPRIAARMFELLKIT